jgi:beta-fructofuranosidase
VRARPDDQLERWHADPDQPLVTPPAELDATNFRDPCIFRHDGQWVMVVGAGTRPGVGAVVQFTSADLLTWDYTGVLCERSATDTEPLWTGAMWECPQLFPLGGAWVLVISVWDHNMLHHVVAATGDYDGRRFTPRRWQQLTHGDSAYAMTSFVDCSGQRCVTSWLREDPHFDPLTAVRAGAHSVPYAVSSAEDGWVLLAPHPDVELLRGARVEAVKSVAGHHFEPAGAFDLVVSGSVDTAVSLYDGDEEVLSFPTEGATRVIVDRDIVEVSSRAGLTAYRLSVRDRVTAVSVSGGTVQATCWELNRAWDVT